MISLLLLVVASLGAALTLLWSGLGRTHKAVTTLLVYDALVTLALLLRPPIWSPGRYFLVNGGVCLLSALVGVEAGRRAKASMDVWIQAVCLVGAGAAGAAVLMTIPSDAAPFRPMLAAYFAAAGVLGTVAQRLDIRDAIDSTCLWGLGATRWLQALRIGLVGFSPWWSSWAGAAATVTWSLWCLMIYWTCFSAVAAARRP